MVRHEEANKGPVVQSISQSAATTPAIVGICLGATLFLVGIVAVTLFFYRRKSFVRRKSGVYLTRRSPLSEQIPLQSQLVIHRRRSDTAQALKTQHLVMAMKKSPSPPIHYTSPKNLSPMTPPTEEHGGSPVTSRFSTTAEIHQRFPKSNLASPLSSPMALQHNPLREKSLSPRLSPQISPVSNESQTATDVLNQRNGNSGSSSHLNNLSPTSGPPEITRNPPKTNQSPLLPNSNTQQVVLHGGGDNSLGILHFRIRYKADKGALIVAVVRCEDLPVKDTTLMTCDPYVKLQLLPEKQQRVKTRVLRHTRQPVYEEDFTFTNVHPNQLEGITLHFVVLSFDRYSRDDVIGEVFCPLAHMELPQTDNHHLDISRDIQPRNLKMKAQGRGEVLLSLCWQPTANRLTVVVLKARNLPKMDVTGLADPYVKLYLLSDGARISKKKTHIKKRTLNPVFNESFVFDLPPPTGQTAGNHLDKVSLQLQLLDWDRVTKNEVIGRLELGNGATSATATHHWAEVLSCPRRQIAEWHKLRD